MKSVRPSDGLVSARLTLELLEFVRRQGGAVRVGALLDSMRSLHAANLSKVRNTARLLADMGLLRVTGDLVSGSVRDTGANLRDAVTRKLVDYYVRQRQSDYLLASALQFGKDMDVWVDSKRMPGHSVGLPYILVDFGIFRREHSKARHWRLAPEFLSQVMSAFSNGLSATALESQMDAKANAGKLAEDWVVGFEKTRLASHPWVSYISCISETNVSAGYDVLSFRACDSTSFDWRIEVKSFVGHPTFYWTANEVNCARRMRERYVLYLVDRSRIRDEEYSPHVIRQPYRYFFETPHDEWQLEPSEYRVTKRDVPRPTAR